MSGENASTIDTLMELRSTSDFLDEDQTEVTNAALHAFRYFSAVVTAILLAVGLCGNMLTICAMTSREYWSKPYSRFVVALAVSDACVMAMVPFNKTIVRQLLQYDVRSFSDHSCRFFYWAFRMAKITSSWMIVAITSERYNYVQHNFVQRIRILSVKLFFAYIFTS